MDERDRHVVTGNCMDQRCLSQLVRHCLTSSGSVTAAQPFRPVPALKTTQKPLQEAEPTHLGSHVAAYACLLWGHCELTAADVAPSGGESVLALTAGAKESTAPHAAFAGNKRLAKAAQWAERGLSDIHEDEATLQFLRGGKLPEHFTPAMSKRVLKRARRYRLVTQEGQERVMYRFNDGSYRTVPPPADRRAIIDHAHVSSGHFGANRTAHLLLTNYWWRGILKNTKQAVAECGVCDRVAATFDARQPELQPLPIMGLFYRWGMDLCGPFAVTERGNKYVAVMIEHFSKTVVLAPLVSKEAKHTTYAFEVGVLSRFGACAELVTDQGTEFRGEFAEMCARNFIDHRTTSANHPPANGLAERCVQTVKSSLRKYCEGVGAMNRWDEHLPYLALGYNCSKQQSTGFSPYHLLYAREPHFLAPGVAQRMEAPLNLDKGAVELENGDQAAGAVWADLLARMEVVRQQAPCVANRLAIAQQRDKLRYAMTRSGAYMPVVRKFSVGDFVYLRAPSQSTLRIKAQQVIVRVIQVKDSGVLVVQGRCGQTRAVHSSNVAPCHLPHLDGTIDPELAIPAPDLSCEVCGFPDDEAVMILCEYCGTGWHTYCLEPPLPKVPGKAEVWLCPNCVKAGITRDQMAEVRERRLQVRGAQAARGHRGRGRGRGGRGAGRGPAPAATARKEEAKAAEAYTGRLVRQVVVLSTGASREQWGVAHFRGDQYAPEYLEVRYADGSVAFMTVRGFRALKPLPAGTPMPGTEPVKAAERSMD